MSTTQRDKGRFTELFKKREAIIIQQILIEFLCQALLTFVKTALLKNIAKKVWTCGNVSTVHKASCSFKYKPE